MHSFMADGRGGRRPGAGRKAGGTNKRTREFRADVAASGLNPVEYMLGVMRDEKVDAERRDRMAAAVAPYVSPKLAVIDSTIRAVVDVTPLTEEQRRERARRLIAEAFRERPPRVVEGEYKVIGGRNVASDVAAQVNSEASDEREG